MTNTNTAIGAADKVLVYLDDLSDDAAAHIFPSDLAKCMTSECVAEVFSVRAGNPNEKTVPLFSREQVVAALASAAAPAEQPGEIQNLRKALQFYADKDHFNIADEGAWDTVSGEPQNYWCDEEGTATVEDGTIARLALAGHQIKFDADNAPQPSPTPQADSQPAPDERDDFEKVFPLPSGCIRVGTGYASTGYSNWAAHTHCERWQGWQARASRGQAPAGAASVTDAMVLAALQVQYPAGYDTQLRHPANGPKTSARTEAEIDLARRMIAAALATHSAPAAQAPSVLEDAALPQAARDVLAERQRQISTEGWTPEHDDEHVNDEIAAMACYYVMPPGAREWSGPDGYGATLGEAIRPEGWDAKDCDRRRELVKGAALALAELERIDRAAMAAKKGDNHD